jgi:hypothetical protein
LGGYIQNPLQSEDENINLVEPIYIDLVNPATLHVTDTTTEIQPGQTFKIPDNFAGNVSINAATSGHRFSAFIVQTPPAASTPQIGTFPPAGPTTLTQTIPAYLYQQYNSDAACQAFFTAFNTLAQGYVDWFVNTPLGVWTNPNITGTLLDWIALGLYGMDRPTLSSGLFLSKGPYNTWAYNTIPYNKFTLIGPSNIAVTTDDIFKRILTWNLYRGDGNVFSITWLKRRVMRFLLGTDGSAPNVDDTSPVSVTVGNNIVTIAINNGTRKVTGGALYNRFAYNKRAYNSISTLFVPGSGTALPDVNVLKEALEAGVLVLPFQYQFIVLL